jgi:hypothetical protein
MQLAKIIGGLLRETTKVSRMRDIPKKVCDVWMGLFLVQEESGWLRSRTFKA